MSQGRERPEVLITMHSGHSSSARALSVSALVNELRFGNWVIKVGTLKQAHNRDGNRRKAIKHISLQSAWIDDGRTLCIGTTSSTAGDEHARTQTEDFAVKDLIVERTGTATKPIYTLSGMVTVEIGKGAARRPAQRRRVIAAFQRSKQAKAKKTRKPATPRPMLRSAA